MACDAQSQSWRRLGGTIDTGFPEVAQKFFGRGKIHTDGFSFADLDYRIGRESRLQRCQRGIAERNTG